MGKMYAVNACAVPEPKETISSAIEPVAELLDQRRILIDKLEAIDRTLSEIRRMVGA